MGDLGRKKTIVNFNEWIKRDWIAITILLIALLACIYTLNQSGTTQQKVNHYWISQLQTDPCLSRCINTNPGGYNYESYYNNTNTARTS
jgi:hypothetical protein